MITPFPMQRPPQPVSLGWGLALHTEETAVEDEAGLAWVRWLFQSVRIRCRRLVFTSQATDRARLLADWAHFAETSFLPVLAPALLQARRCGEEGDDAALAATDREWGAKLSPAQAEASLTAGGILLEKTQGAKYQGALGRVRRRISAGEADGHLMTVWGGLAALFQLPPVDLLSEYLREEWLVTTSQEGHRDEPQGGLSFAGLTQKALHQALGASLTLVRTGPAERDGKVPELG